MRRKEREALLKEQALDAAAAERMAEYRPLLTELGVPAETIERISSKLKDLHRSAMKAGDPMQELMLARAEYDSDMKTLLGPESYEKYRAYESDKPFRREITALKNLASDRKVEVTEVQEQELAGLFRKANLQTAESWDGPYDPPPVAIVGEGAHLARNQAMIENLTVGWATIQKQSEWMEFPDELKNLVHSYLNEHIQKLDRSNKEMEKLSRLGAEDKSRLLEDRLREHLKKITPERNIEVKIPTRELFE